ncbi:predicted protein [Arabidopsis lyrata subsp. lyrata]|uniref:Predicted protein n=1 Tax=Arabidopsis lyrata subsp. lyrata TaxID=81972 RepID=D7LYQ8_ARALL|nr:predicted protein [Arabidopsis lyrata subsp. lyrata]
MFLIVRLTDFKLLLEGSVEPGRRLNRAANLCPMESKRPSTNPHRSHLLELIFLKRNTRDRSAVITGDRSKPSLIGNINRKTIQATGFRFHLVTWIKVLDSICAILKMIGVLH